MKLPMRRLRQARGGTTAKGALPCSGIGVFGRTGGLEAGNPRVGRAGRVLGKVGHDGGEGRLH
eukprot:4008921-Alexandrium_andersonii.AAC.1